MHKKRPKNALVVELAQLKFTYITTEIAKARPHSEDWQIDSYVQKQWSMPNGTAYFVVTARNCKL